MSATKTLTLPNVLTAYMELNESNKKKLRDSFCKEFDYAMESNTNTFYRKLHDPRLFWSHEKKWLAEQLKTTVSKLFGKEAVK